MWIAGIVIAIVGGGLFWFSGKQKKTSEAMKQSKVIPTSQVQPGMQAEVQGTIAAEVPLKTPFSGHPCVYYEFEVEKEVRRKNQQGQWETDWETVEQDSAQVVFRVRDAAGEIQVEPDGATLEPRDLGERRYRRGDRFRDSDDILSSVLNAVSNSNVRVNEKALLIGENAYVFGPVAEGPVIRDQKGKDFVISYKTEAEVEKSTTRSATIMKVLGIIGLIVGAVVFIMGLTG